MEATAVSIGKSVLNGALGYAKSAMADEVALQLGVHRDKAFVTDELEMMQSFMMVAHDERDDHNKVIKTWVKQVRDVAYDVEDGLQDFVVRLQKQKQSWWHIPRRLLDRRHVAKHMKELRTKVEDVSQRNVRYGLIKGSSSTEPATAAASAAMFGVDEARHAAKQHQSRQDLAQLINKEGVDLQVIGVWGTSGSVGHTSIIWEAYENPIVKLSFPCRAWVRVTRPLHPTELVWNMVKQFRAATGVGVFLEGGRTDQELAQEFNGYVNGKRYLVVITGLSIIEEWHQIRTCFPENKLGSRIVVSTEQAEVASLCPGQASIVSELKELSADQNIYAFYQQRYQGATNSSKAAHSSTLPCTAENEIQEDQSTTDVDGKMIVQERLIRTNTMAGVLKDFQLIGREKEKSNIIELIREQASTLQFEVIVMWGMGGLGKTTLIKDVYQREEVTKMFEKHAFVTVLRPFNLEELLRSLALQLRAMKGAMDFAGDSQKSIASMGVADLTEALARLSQGMSCLIVLDDLLSTTEWDKIFPILLAMKNPSLVVVITTRREDIAKHCCKKPKCRHLLQGLEDKDACNLFTKKVFKNKTTDLAKHYPELVEPAKLIIKKCGGLPLAIVTIGGFLADQPTKTATEWRKLNENISVELEMNTKLEPIKTLIMKSYDGLPYYLKSSFLYLSIFPEDRSIRQERLVCRWFAEGYARNRSVAEKYFTGLLERSVILPTEQSVFNTPGIDSCQLHDLIRDISIAESAKENLVFRLEKGCSPNIHGVVRHLSISSNWEGDKHELESTVDLSHIRSLTVFGKCRPFYVSDKMRFLRVLDLEDTEGLKNHHLEHVGKFLHLRYLSLRGCWDITYLQDSVGNLRQLETLDIMHTGIWMLPKTIIKLSKLHYLHAHHVKVPTGIRKLKTLHTLRHVNIERGNAVVREIKYLTSLRNLGVANINRMNGPELCAAISSSLGCLESLSVKKQSDDSDLYECLHAISPPPENLQSLMLYSCLKKLPEWIKGLQNLTELILENSGLSGDAETMRVLGNLPQLSILRLWERWFQIEEPITFRSGLFGSLVVLDLGLLYAETKSLEFEPSSLQKLEVLKLHFFNCKAAFSGLEFLPSIKEVRLIVNFFENDIKREENMTEEEAAKEASRREDIIKDDIRKQLASNQNGPTLKIIKLEVDPRLVLLA